jgi:tetratricopeptide (TPR) repeat protein
LVALLAEWYLRRDRLVDAETRLRAYIDSAESPAQAAEEVGDWCIARGLAGQAVTYYREAAQASEASPELHLKLAQAYSGIGWTYEMIAAVDAFVTQSGGSRAARLTAFELLAGQAQWIDAARILEPVYATEAGDVEVAMALANARFQAGQAEGEIAIYEQLMADSANPGELALDIAAVYVDRSAYSQAISWLEQASQIESSRPQALLALISAQVMLEDAEAVWAATEAYLASADQRLDAYEQILDLLNEHRQRVLMIQLLERMTTLFPSHRELRLRLAEQWLRSGDATRAEEIYLAYGRDASDPGEAAREVSWSLRHDPELAEAILETLALERSDAPGIALAAAELALEQANAALAEPDLEAHETNLAAARRGFALYLAANPGDANEVLRAANDAENAELYDLAARGYDRAADLGASMDTVRTDYGLALVRSSGSSEQAIALIQGGIRDSENATERAVHAAEVFAEYGQVDSALVMIQSAYERAGSDSERATVFRVGAGILLEDGRLEELAALANRHVESSRDQLSALRNSAELLVSAGRWTEARARLELALTLAPNQTDVLNDLALDLRKATNSG